MKLNFAGWIGFWWFFPLLAVWAQESPGPVPTKEELEIRRVGTDGVKVTQNGQELPSQNVHVQVLSNPSTSSALSSEQRRELERWRFLSRYPLTLRVHEGTLIIEWLGAKQTVPLQEDGEIQIQLHPQ